MVDENLNDERRRENEREHVSGRACVVTRRYVKRIAVTYIVRLRRVIRRKKREREREREKQ